MKIFPKSSLDFPYTHVHILTNRFFLKSTKRIVGFWKQFVNQYAEEIASFAEVDVRLLKAFAFVLFMGYQ